MLATSAAGPAFAVLPEEQLKDPVLEARARHLSKELRCVVCQNQTIDDSDAPLAADLRAILRERLTAGDSDEQAKAYLVQRYGDFVLLKPPVNPATLFLWFGPALLLLGGGFGVWRYWQIMILWMVLTLLVALAVVGLVIPLARPRAAKDAAATPTGILAD
eukprot:gene29629-30080_t